MSALPYLDTIRSTSWLDSTHVAGAPTRACSSSVCGIDDGPQLGRIPRAAQVGEVEHRVQFAGVDVPGQPYRVGEPDLADEHPVVVFVGDRCCQDR